MKTEWAIQALAFVVVASAVVAGLVVGRDLLIPLVIAVFIWYLINGITRLFELIPIGRFRLPRSIGFILALILIVFSLALLVRIIQENVVQVTQLAPVYQKKLVALTARAQVYFHVPESIRLTQYLRGIDFGFILSQIALAIYNLTSKVGIITIFLIFLFLEQSTFRRKMIVWLNVRGADPQAFEKLLQRVDSDVRKYLGIKTFTSALTGLVSYAILQALNIDFAGFWALLIFLLNYIPTFGSIIASVFPIMLALVQFDSLAPALILTIALVGLQFGIGNVLEPKLMGESLNVSPLFLVISLTFWGLVWGVPGMILCVPILVVIVIVLARFERTKSWAILLSKDGSIKGLDAS